MSNNNSDGGQGLQSNGSQAANNSTNGASGDKQNGSSDGTDTPMEVRKSLSPIKSDESSNSSFERVSGSEAVEGSTFADVIQTLSKRHYNIKDGEDLLAEGKCKYYFNKDYHCEVVVNSLLCPNYPSGLIIPVACKENAGEIAGSAVDFNKELYAEQIASAKHTRIRSRFPVPVILFDNKFICRSGTIANSTSAAYNQAIEALPPATSAEPVSVVGSTVETVTHIGKCLASGVMTIMTDTQELCKKDAEILKHLKVDHVFDLMIEYGKVYKDVIKVSSCEVLHKDVYRTLKMQDLPFPGCEFFTEYSKANRDPEGLKFDWSQGDVTRNLILTDDLQKLIPDLDVTKMQEWDLVEITKNYLKIILAYLVKDKSSILVHCISGWDRTPLFISLLRLTLWADNVIHQSLDAHEMAYLTVTYDWFLFGHAFPNRWMKKEEVMHFCFNFLSHIATDEFSITKMFKRLPAEERQNRQFPEYEPGRRVVLNDVRQYVLDAYTEHIIEAKETEGA